MPTTTNVEKVKLNIMTTAQYTVATIDPNQLYMVTDAQISYNDLSNKPNLATVATTGSYNDLTNKPTIPTVNNATLTIQKNGTTVKTFTANASSNVTCNITVPTDTSDLTNGAGYTTNVGTVTSVNNVSPVNGNVTLSIPSIDNLANKDLSNLSTTGNSKFQEPLVSGTNIKTINNTSILGSGNISVQADPAIDNKSITKNTSDQIQTVGVIDQASSSRAIKTWTGTSANVPSTKDANTLYNITDDASSFQNVLESIYPVGAIYIGTMSICPLAALFGTWQLVSAGRVLQGADNSHSAGSTISAGLPNIEGYFNGVGLDWASNGTTNLFTYEDGGNNDVVAGSTNRKKVKFDASLANSIYGNSTTVQPPAFVVNIWQRTA